jgi:26S proteasome non-ATPase regulatory subunit 9
MHVGDLVIDFGGVDVTNNNNLIGVRDLVMKNENKSLDLYVQRGADVLHLTLTPKKWSGQGLLGCHLLPHK